MHTGTDTDTELGIQLYTNKNLGHEYDTVVLISFLKHFWINELIIVYIPF